MFNKLPCLSCWEEQRLSGGGQGRNYWIHRLARAVKYSLQKEYFFIQVKKESFIAKIILGFTILEW